MKTLFIESKVDINLKQVLNNIPNVVKEDKIGLVSTVQHVHQLNDLKKALEDAGKEVYIGTPLKFKNLISKQGIYSVHKGQVLGCDASAAIDIANKVDCILYLGTGLFHPLEILFKTDQKVYAIDPFTAKVELLDQKYKKKYLAKQAARMHHAKNAKCYGILLSTKPGQYYINAIKQIKNLAKKHGKDIVILVADTIIPNDLLNFPQVDCYINTACPRIAEDQENYPKTVINFTEFLKLFE